MLQSFNLCQLLTTECHSGKPANRWFARLGNILQNFHKVITPFFNRLYFSLSLKPLNKSFIFDSSALIFFLSHGHFLLVWMWKVFSSCSNLNTVWKNCKEFAKLISLTWQDWLSQFQTHPRESLCESTDFRYVSNKLRSSLTLKTNTINVKDLPKCSI